MILVGWERGWQTKISELESRMKEEQLAEARKRLESVHSPAAK
jgi:hypothetical protein